jgi:hypothetical protein
MAKRRKWSAKANHSFEPGTSELKRNIILAYLGELIYKEVTQFREFQNQIDPSIAARSVQSHCNKTERKVANAKAN